MSLEDEFTQALLEGYKRAGNEVGYWGYYFLRSVKKEGGLQTARKMLAKSGTRGKTAGFSALQEVGRQDLSVEAVVLRPKFRELFSESELAIARSRLAQFPKRQQVPVQELFPESLPDGTYVEGAVRQVTVSVYERDPKARAACIKRHGARCIVCRLDFSERYGEIGHGFIHVHHIRPLASRRREYQLNPTKDLVPVCPNCHAMLHTSAPPLSVEELKSALKQPG